MNQCINNYFYLFSYNILFQMSKKTTQHFKKLQLTYTSIDDYQNHQISPVWDHNFKSQMKNIIALSQTFNIISIDTEFPGICGPKCTNLYRQIESTIHLTKLIQVGMTLCDQNGNTPYPVNTWQFNLKFDIGTDIIDPEAKQLLENAGVQFEKMKSEGIYYQQFADIFYTSALMFNHNIKWVAFHGCYDFAYLLKLITGQSLPNNVTDFHRQIGLYFPNISDLKSMIRPLNKVNKFGLNKLADYLGCVRKGNNHTAGSDSLLTMSCFIKLFEKKQTCEIAYFMLNQNHVYGTGQDVCLSLINFYEWNKKSYQNLVFLTDSLQNK